MKNHYREGIGCKGRVSSSMKNRYWEELGAEEEFLFYKESLLGRNWEQMKVSSSMKNH